MVISQKEFGLSPYGMAHLYTFTADSGASISITNYGGIIQSFNIPTNSDTLHDVVLGFDTLEEYVGIHPFFGCITGRVANRIDQGRFAINGTTYHLPQTIGPHCLHGGIEGFDKKLWNAEVRDLGWAATLELSYESKHLEEGFPGNLKVTVRYTFTQQHALIIDYEYQSDQDTFVILTNHSYFNLGNSATIKDHSIQLNAYHILETDHDSIPNGNLLSVENTPFDLRKETIFADRLNQPALARFKGFDNYFVYDAPNLNQLRAIVKSPSTGIKMLLFTTEPGTQLYCANYLDGSQSGKNNPGYQAYSGFCLETHSFPNAINVPQWHQAAIARQGKTYTSRTIYSFDTEQAS